jgi:hypothetical protein
MARDARLNKLLISFLRLFHTILQTEGAYVQKALYKDTPPGIRCLWETEPVKQHSKRKEAHIV